MIILSDFSGGEQLFPSLAELGTVESPIVREWNGLNFLSLSLSLSGRRRALRNLGERREGGRSSKRAASMVMRPSKLSSASARWAIVRFYARISDPLDSVSGTRSL